jgi:hypothetical protein
MPTIDPTIDTNIPDPSVDTSMPGMIDGTEGGVTNGRSSRNMQRR